MIEIVFQDAERTVRVRGHANFAPPGADIVCAAVSALTQALIDAGTDYRAETRIDPRGEVRVRCRPEKEQEQACDAMLRAILLGYWNVEREHPGFVRVEYEK